MNGHLLIELYSLLTSNFDQEELLALAFDLNVTYDDLHEGEGVNKAGKLIMFMAEQKRLPELVEAVRNHRPNADWPSLSEDSAQKDIPSSQETGVAATPGGTGSTFNISGDIEASLVNPGGIQTFTAPIHVDMQETIINQPTGEVIMGDRIEMSGDFRGAIVNVKSRLDNATQTIEALPRGNDSEKEELLRLVTDLEKQLEQVPADKVEDAEKVSKRVEALAREIDAEKPDREMVEITGESLKRAAENLKDVLPTVLAIATQIALCAMRFAV